MNNIVYNRAEVIVNGLMTLSGFLDNNFGSQLEVNSKLLIQPSGTVKTTGNAINASNITCYDLENHGYIENENML